MIALWLAATFACIVSSGFFSGCETGLYCLNAVRLRLGERMGKRPAVMLSRMLRDREGIIATTLAGTNLSNYLATICVVSLLTAYQMDESRAEVVTTLMLTPIIFVFAEVTPKNLFQREADTLMTRLVWPLRISDLLFRGIGVIALLKGLARLAAKCVGVDGHGSLASLAPRQQVAVMLREGVGAGVLSEHQSAMVDRVMSLSGMPARSAMIDRRDVRSIPAGSSREVFIEAARVHDYTRMPVIEEGDRVVGVVSVFDVLADQVSEGGVARPVSDFVAAPMFVSPDRTVTSALTEMRQRGVSMAIVNDDGGRFIGIVTVKDLVEEIVGDLQAW